MKKLTLLATDIVVLYGALAIVLLARYGSHQWSGQWAAHIVPFTVLFIVWVLSFYIANLYEERTLRNDRDFYERLVQAIAVAATLSVLFFYLIPYFGIAPKINLFLFIATFALLSGGARSAANQAIAGGSKERVLIVGIDAESLELARFIDDHPQLGWTVHALVRLGQETLPLNDEVEPWDIIHERADLAQYIRQEHIETVTISPQAYTSPRLINMLYQALSEQINFCSLSSFTEQLTGTVPLGAISQKWFLENFAEGSKKSYENAKRVMDVFAGGILGIATLIIAPLVALAIRLDSSGPIFFRQHRTGRGGIPFSILKFRTMRVDAEKNTGAVWATENDPRATRVGKFLRKTRIDELPQAWNIIKGEMSLVGPRAERPEFDTTLIGEMPFYQERYLVKPGLSGWAQINYPYGASTQDAMRKLEYDLYYIKRRSIALDLEIVLKTINISLRRAGR
jgi:exopolysaccharide biosynthesis polyprenyl glycosylphosphotransferase